MKKITLLILTCLVFQFSIGQDISMTNGTFNQCSGVFTDSGGASGAYGNNEDFTLTICPDVAGDAIQLDFTAFNTQVNADILNIFNGPDATAVPFGPFSGGPASSPGTIQALIDTNPSGCLTITFTSNGTGVTTGWEANISCITPCQNINAQFDGFTIAQTDGYDPQPNSNGFIRACAGEAITFNGSGTFSSDGTGATYEWDFGDGTTGAGTSATHAYTAPGIYVVNLEIRDANTGQDPLGCTNNNLINQLVQISTTPDFTGTEALDSDLCFGETTTISGIATPVRFESVCDYTIARYFKYSFCFYF